MQQPDTTFTAASFAWVGSDPDGDQTIASYEIALNFNGVPFELIPRAASEVKSGNKFRLLSVNEAEYHRNPCFRLVAQRRGRWELTSHGLSLLELLTY